LIKLLHLTDLHVVPAGGRLFGLDPAERLEAVLTEIRQRHSDTAGLIITGDLADHGDDRSYHQLRHLLTLLPFPTVLVPGNHDRPERMAAAFDGSKFITAPKSARLAWPDFVVLALDTSVTGDHSGALCLRRLSWLRSSLIEDRERGVLLFMHHPPFRVGLQAGDKTRLRDGDALADVLEPHRQRIRHLSFGHLHRPISGAWRGYPFSVVAATHNHGLLDMASARSRGQRLPPAYAVILIDAETVVVHHNYVAAEPDVYEYSDLAEAHPN
jgi:3',5'-cyclic AMP phosphodiesterase CpdA